MDLRSLIQIVPELPPRISGVGDYALLLAGELRRVYDIHTTFMVGDPKWEGPPEIEGFSVTRVVGRCAAPFESLLNSLAPGVPVLLHYVGYGYEKRGCPDWLVRGLEAWRRRRGQKRLVTMFHELYAFGAPWTSSFWTSLLQQWLSARLARLSDCCITNMRRYARCIEGWLPAPHPSRVTVLPVFSNVGELTQSRPWKERPSTIVVFGSAGWRKRVYVQHRDALLAACWSFNIGQIVDIGPSLSAPMLPVRLVQYGTLNPSEASQLMAAARFGFLACPAHCLAKSSIFAAYAAHEMTPVTFESNVGVNEDGLRPGEHYVALGRDRICEEHKDASYIAQSASAWYRGHSVGLQAARFGEMLSYAV